MTVPAPPLLAATGLLGVTVTAGDVVLLVAIGVLLAATVFLSAAEAALTRVSRTRAQGLADDDEPGAEALCELVGDARSFLSPLRLAGLLCMLVEATLVGVVGERLFATAGLVAATVANVVVVFVLAESAPRTWAVLDAERAALRVAPAVRLVVRFPPLRILSRALIWLTNLVVPGQGLAEGPYLSEGELLAVADMGVDEGVIEPDERALIESIIEFGDTLVREVMVPRPDMITVDASFRVADVMEVVLLNGYSRLPVRGEGIDDVIGLVYAKDLMRAERDGKEHERVSEFLRPPRFVPETKRVPEMLREMQQDQFHMAIVVDEYGGTAGLVTLEDLIEELVGEIVDEFDVEDPLIEPLPGGDLRVHARTPLDEVNDLLRANLPEGDWDTIGGLLYRELGHVPYEGESVDLDGWRLVAQRVQGRRIGRVQISRLDAPSGPKDAPPRRSPPPSSPAPPEGASPPPSPSPSPSEGASTRASPSASPAGSSATAAGSNGPGGSSGSDPPGDPPGEGAR
ncbi:MAG TPA: hemolysin family protein, partial [Acidimicrobiales bacterium]